MGTPEFAVPTLEKLIKKGYDICAVITAPDKPAGRGMKLNESAVKQFAIKNGLRVLQPENLKSVQFINEYQALECNLNIVVAFRMLPESIWSYPEYGTFNLHASLLPQYRGAAPINWAIINGETETGVTTFFINHEIDTGKIILQEKVSISEYENAGDLHDKLMIKGADLVIKTVDLIENEKVNLIDQSQIIENQEIKLLTAPKIFKKDCEITLDKGLRSIYNKIRGLSPFPTAYLEVVDAAHNVSPLKIYDADYELFENNTMPGVVESDGKSYIHIHHKEGILILKKIQLPGRKMLGVIEFLRGYSLSTNNWSVKSL